MRRLAAPLVLVAALALPAIPARALSHHRPWWHPVAAPYQVGDRSAGPGIVDLYRTGDRTVRVTLRDPMDGRAEWSAEVRGQVVSAGRVPGGILAFGQEGEPASFVPGLRQIARLYRLEGGTAVWTRSYTQQTDGVSDRGYAAMAGVLRDADGDDQPDPVVSILDRHPGGVTQLSTVVVSGRTGTDLARHTVEGIRSSAQTVPSGDLDGDGLSDLFSVGVINANATEVLRLNGVRGRDGTVLWSRDVTRMPASTIDAFMPIGDGNGDGRDDLLVMGPASGTNSTSTATVYSGRDGSTLWSRPFAGAVAKSQPLGEGDALVASIPPAGSGAIGLNVSRLDGATGVHVWDRVYTLPGTTGYTDWRLDWGDASGDGLADLYVAIVSNAPDAASHEWLISGASGDPLWHHDHGEAPGPVIQTFRAPAGRAAGQGLWYQTGDGIDDRITIVDGPTGEPLWSTPTGFGMSWAAASADGDGVGDVLRATGQGLSAFDGRDGRALWSVTG